MTGQLLEYATPSAFTRSAEGAALALGTVGGSWAGDAASPVFFEGVVGEAGPLATAMLVLGRVATTRFYVPPGMLAAVLRAADPVFTSTPDSLRLEAFSPCAGVYARFDLDASLVDTEAVTSGVTNVDFNEGMRSLLSGVAAGEPLHLSVATDGVTVNTLDGAVTEQKVALPERWLRSFAESQVIASAMDLRAEPDVIALRRLVRDLPRTTPTASVAWVQPVAGGLRLASTAGAGAVGLAGPERLRVLEPLLQFTRSVRVYSDGGPASFWELTTALGRFTLGLSVAKSRGFSGEGGLLESLAAAVDGHADLVERELGFDPRVDTAALAASTALAPQQVDSALASLAAQGLLGYDAHRESWFHRPLPYDAALTGVLHPRLAAANALAEQVQLREDGSFAVGQYRVRLGAHDTCTCAWYGKHRGDRGPCKHVLAARMTRMAGQ
jgi:hypothetical protein